MRARLLIALAALVLPLAFIHAAEATAPLMGTGTFTLTGAPLTISSRTVGGNTFLVQTFMGIVYAGAVTCASVTETATFVIHPDGAGSLRGTDVSDACTVAGYTGPYADQIEGTVDAQGNYAGHFVLSGSGGLAAFHGEGSFWGNLSSPTGYYSIQYSVD